LLMIVLSLWRVPRCLQPYAEPRPTVDGKMFGLTD
jgi:hypothetical protein